jgi:hypothetical protein
MQIFTFILSVSILAAPLPAPNPTVQSTVVSGAKNAADAVWTGTKIAASGLAIGAGLAVGTVGANSLMNRNHAPQQIVVVPATQV